MHLPEPIIQIFMHFLPAFSTPSYRKMLWLVCGTLLARGRRTGSLALKMLGLDQTHNWPKYHNLLNRAKWSSLKVAALLLDLLVKTLLAPNAPVEVIIDETLERRWGPKIKKRGHWRDSLASSQGQNVTSSGLRWSVAALAVKLPWSRRVWALPFLSVLMTTPKVSQHLGRRHKTSTRHTIQMLKWLRHTLPKRAIKLIGDGAYSVIELGLACQKYQVSLIAPLRLDARLFEAAPERGASTKAPSGYPPRIVGQRLPNLTTIIAQATAQWQACQAVWYGGSCRQVELVTGTAWWYSTGLAPLALRWVIVRDPKGRLPTKAYFSTDLTQEALAIVQDFVKRWNTCVTFEEVRAHLGVETQRQWSDLAIERTTPALMGLFSLSCLFGLALYPAGKLPLHQTAWYAKTQASFSDVLAVVRRALWGNFNFKTSAASPELCLVPRAELERLI